MERDDLSLPVVPGGVEIGLGYRNLRLRAEDTPLGARALLERFSTLRLGLERQLCLLVIETG